jgi:methanogenic corrinoid protein MtbC1
MMIKNKSDKPLNDQSKQHNLLIELIADLKEKESISEVKDMLASGWEPTDIMDICIQGMHEVGKRFEDGRYFISALIMAGDIMRQATDIIEVNFLQKKSDQARGVILLGTIRGDIHDLGKNLFAILARCEGFQVVDLGVDVPPERFLEEAKKIKPDLVGISCLLTSVLPELKTAIELLRREFPGHHSPVIIGGNCIDEHIFHHVQSDYWAENAVQGVKICRSVIEKQ